jgi:hypothetical protein
VIIVVALKLHKSADQNMRSDVGLDDLQETDKFPEESNFVHVTIEGFKFRKLDHVTIKEVIGKGLKTKTKSLLQ